MNENIIKEFIVAYYTKLYNSKTELSLFYSPDAKTLRGNKKHEGNPISKAIILPIPKESSVTIERYGYFIINKETASISVTGLIETKNLKYNFSQNFVLRSVNEEQTSQKNDNEHFQNRCMIVSDIFYEFTKQEKTSNIVMQIGSNTNNNSSTTNTTNTNQSSTQNKKDPSSRKKRSSNNFIYRPDKSSTNSNSNSSTTNSTAAQNQVTKPENK